MTRRIAILILTLLLFAQSALAAPVQRPLAKAASELNQPIELEGKLKIIKKTKTAPAHAILTLTTPRVFETDAGTSPLQHELEIRPVPKKALANKLVRVTGPLIAQSELTPLARAFGVMPAAVKAIPKATSVTLNQKDSFMMGEGDWLQLIATVKPAAAQQKVSWSSSNPSVAAVDDNGLVTTKGAASGKATITARTANGKKATCSIEFHGAYAGTMIAPVGASIEVGETLQMKAWIDSKRVDHTSVHWTSSDPSVASVSASGLVTGLSKGSIYIHCTDKAGNRVGQCMLTVARPDPANAPVDLYFKKGVYYLRPGKQQKLSPTVKPAKFNLSAFTYYSSNPQVATVNQAGLVTTHAPGMAVVYMLASYSDPADGFYSPSVVFLVSDTEQLPPDHKVDAVTANDFKLSVNGQTLEIAMLRSQVMSILPGLTRVNTTKQTYFDDVSSGIRLQFVGNLNEDPKIDHIGFIDRSNAFKTARGIGQGDSVWDVLRKYGEPITAYGVYMNGRWAVECEYGNNRITYIPRIYFRIGPDARTESFSIVGSNVR